MEWACEICGTVSSLPICEVCGTHRPIEDDALIGVDMTGRRTPQEITEFGDMLGKAIFAALGEHDAARPRSLQKTIGFSGLGGCREFIRATVAGDPEAPPGDNEKVPGGKLNWAAMVGTATGEYIEKVLTELPEKVKLALEVLGGKIRTQESLTLTLPKSGIRVNGSSDILADEWIADLKSKDTLYEVRRKGPELDHQAQICGYLVAAIQQGLLPDTASAHLIYFDRSGKDPWPFVWSIDYPRALTILDVVERRLEDVQKALETAQMAPRDKPTTWCMSVQCPFRLKCWEGYYPTEEIDNPEIHEAARDYAEARDEEKAVKARKEGARQKLIDVEGLTPEFVVKWVSKKTAYGITDTIEVRDRKDILP